MKRNQKARPMNQAGQKSEAMIALRLPVVAAGSEFLVQGYLMRRNILTYKAPPNNEGYDLIYIHPDPRHKSIKMQKAQIRVQVKSRYATDCRRILLVRESTLDAFDYLIVAFLNIGNFFRGNDGTKGDKLPEFYTLPASLVRKHFHTSPAGWPKVALAGMRDELAVYKDEQGFEQIAKALGIPRPKRTVQ